MSLIKVEPASPLKDEFIETDTDENYGRNSPQDEFSKCGDILLLNGAKYLFGCSFCEDKFEQIVDFIEHMEEIHLKKTTEDMELPEFIGEEYLQDEGSNSEINEENLEFLETSDMDQEPPQSKSIEKSLKQKPSRSPIAAKETYYCISCNKQFMTHSGWYIHNKKKHSIESLSLGYKASSRKKVVIKKSHRCKFCPMAFTGQKKQEEHERTHTGETPFQCSICPKRFRTKRQAEDHLVTHQDIRRYCCAMCPGVFKHKTSLRAHILTHSGEESKKFQCDFCDKKFLRNVDRRIHMRIHTKEKPYQCDQCGDRFITSARLTDHKYRHSNTKRFECDVCQKRFFSSQTLKGHMAIHSNDRPFKCDICGATFPRKKTLQTHVKIHSEVKQYVCKICGKGFSQSPGLYAHMKSHG